jgi:L-lactate dehydrogenase complex protein LldG
LKLGLRGYGLIAVSPTLFGMFQYLGGLLSHIYSPRRAYMHIPAWTGWGYSKDFPRLSASPFHRQWKNIKQDVNPNPRTTSPGSPAETTKPVVGKSRATQFTEELIALGGKVTLVSENDLPGKLNEFLAARGVDAVYVDDVGARYVTRSRLVRQPDPQTRVGVTGALMGIADTGSLVLVGGPGTPLTASLLPEIHLAILKSSALVPSLVDALSHPEIRNAAAGIIISGPSRTADIEMTLTIGVHGPGELQVFLIDDSDAV